MVCVVCVYLFESPSQHSTCALTADLPSNYFTSSSPVLSVAALKAIEEHKVKPVPEAGETALLVEYKSMLNKVLVCDEGELLLIDGM